MIRNSVRYINFGLVFRIIGWLLIMESAFMLVPIITAYIYSESDLKAFAISAAITLISGVGLTFGVRSGRKDMGKHEGFILTALIWIAFSLFGMIPFLLCSSPLNINDAFFEAMSGFTTTGCTILPSVDAASNSINIWRCMMQWIGGMGIILFTLAVIPMLNHSGGMQMFNAEVTGIAHDKLRPRISQTAKSLWGIYFLLTAILIGLLWAGSMDFYDSVCHAFSTISTGGFAIHDNSLGYYNSTYITSIIGIFMLLGGTSFALIYKVLHGNFTPLWKNDVFRAYMLTILIFFITIAGYTIYKGNMTDWQSVTIDPLFQVISTITSTGLTITDISSWSPFVLALMLLLMFSGACAGSTSGGAKIDRMLFLIKNTSNELYRSIHPNAVTNIRINDKVASPDIVSKVIAFICIYIMVILTGGIALTAIGLPLNDALFSSFSCVSNTGFGENFATMPHIGKWILSILMLIGRLELFTVLILFTPGFWRQ